MLRVAEIANVSIATVSRVINTPERVAAATRERVYGAMHQLNYSYNALAGGLSRRKTLTLSVIVPTITNPIFAESTKGVQETAAAHGYVLLIGNSDYDAAEEERLAQVFRQHRVDAMIVTSSHPDSPALLDAQQAGLPIVLTYSSRPHSLLPSVGVDNQAAAQQAVEHLLELGHRRIGMLAGTFSASDRSYARFLGYQVALTAYGIVPDPALLVEVQYTFEQGAAALDHLLALPEPPTAIFCANDVLAFGAIRRAADLGLDVPGHLSVIGFDDSPLAATFHPRLTTVYQPAYDMGAQACALALALINGESIATRSIVLPTELRIRETTTTPSR